MTFWGFLAVCVMALTAEGMCSNYLRVKEIESEERLRIAGKK